MKGMNKWLFNSQGLPIAFVENDDVFTADRKYIGEVINDEVYNVAYKGEVCPDDRLYFNPSKTNKFVWGIPPIPIIPTVHYTPYRRNSVFLPHGLIDIESV